MRAKLRAVLCRQEVIRMCGRFVQYQGVADYLRVLGTDRLVVSGYDNQPIAHYNVAPSTRVNTSTTINGFGTGMHCQPVFTPKAGPQHSVQNDLND